MRQEDKGAEEMRWEENEMMWDKIQENQREVEMSGREINR